LSALRPFAAVPLLLLALAAWSIGTADAGTPPDLSGRWQTRDIAHGLRPAGGGPIPFLDTAARRYRETRAGLQGANATFDTMTRCLPAGIPRIYLQPRSFLILQQPSRITIFFEHERMVRHIYLRDKHGDVPDTLYMGHSIGRWQRGTLRVDTNSFKESTFLDNSGIPHSDALHLLERMRLLDANTIEDRIQINDPKVFTRPWTAVLYFVRQSDLHMQEDLCTERLGLW
jgi:hypothetical protein